MSEGVSAATGIIGRSFERDRLASLLASADGARSGAVVVIGEAGIGKSALLDDAVGAAAGMNVIRVVGIESEMNLGYAGLHRLLQNVLDGIEDLPEPQRHALETIFGLTEGPAVDPFLVNLAVLTLLTEAAAHQTVVCVVDDAQWIDEESIAALAFVARRVLADRIAFLFGVRDSPEAPPVLEGLPSLRLEGLDSGSVRELLQASSGELLGRDVIERLTAETAGNPLAILELVGELSADELTTSSYMPVPLPVNSRLEGRFLEQVKHLPPDAQMLLLVAAADTSGEAQMLYTAARGLGIPPQAIAPAEAARIITIGSTVEFRHPLIRSAVYGSASFVERRRVHEALAEATDDTQLDVRAWHLAAAAIGPEPSIAEELERSAARAHGRGAYGAQSGLLARAAELTPSSHDRAGRRLAACVAAATGGNQRRALLLLDLALPELADPRQIAWARWLRGLFLMHQGRYGESPAELLAAAQEFRLVDVKQARIVLLDATGSAALAGRRAIGTSPSEVAATALATPRVDGDEPTRNDLLLDGFATRLLVGYGEALPMLRQAIAGWTPADLPAENVTIWCTLGVYAALETFDDTGLVEWVSAIERSARDRGAVVLLRVALIGASTVASLCGRFDTAEANNVEGQQLNLLTGAPGHLTPLYEVELAGMRGREAEARGGARETIDAAESSGFENAECRAYLSLTRLELALGNWDDALAAAQEVVSRGPIGLTSLVLADAVEAAVRSGDRDAAASAAAMLADRATQSGTAWGLGLAARVQALLAADDDAEEAYARSIDLLGSTAITFDLARSHLVYGEWLRSVGRSSDARTQLRTALDLYAGMGAEAFAQRARDELRSAGERGSLVAVQSAEKLTPQELQVAVLASQGDTNQEIGAQLYISRSTVDYHLRKVFQKLGVQSRRDLQPGLLAADPRSPQVSNG